MNHHQIADRITEIERQGFTVATEEVPGLMTVIISDTNGKAVAIAKHAHRFDFELVLDRFDARGTTKARPVTSRLHQPVVVTERKRAEKAAQNAPRASRTKKTAKAAPGVALVEAGLLRDRPSLKARLLEKRGVA